MAYGDIESLAGLLNPPVESQPSPPGLPSFDVNVDLHIRKEGSAKAGWENLFNELHQAVSSGSCGIMIHHQRMNGAAFDFLATLLKVLAENKKIQLVNFRDLPSGIVCR